MIEPCFECGSDMNSHLFAWVSLAVAEYDRRVRVSRCFGGSMDLGGGWSSFIEDANDDPETICYEICDVFDELFYDYFETDDNEGEKNNLCFALGSQWLKWITEAED
jgi:hypothetical protein